MTSPLISRLAKLEQSASTDGLRVVIVQVNETKEDALKREGLVDYVGLVVLIQRFS